MDFLFCNKAAGIKFHQVPNLRRSLESLRVKGRGPVGLNENIRIYKYLGAFVVRHILGGFGNVWKNRKNQEAIEQGVSNWIPKV